MSDETLLTASRRAVRFLNIDIGKGGLVVEDTEQAFDTLERMVEEDDRPTGLRQAATRLLRDYTLDMNTGGLIRVDTMQSLALLDREVRAITGA